MYETLVSMYFEGGCGGIAASGAPSSGSYLEESGGGERLVEVAQQRWRNPDGWACRVIGCGRWLTVVQLACVSAVLSSHPRSVSSSYSSADCRRLLEVLPGVEVRVRDDALELGRGAENPPRLLLWRLLL